VGDSSSTELYADDASNEPGTAVTGPLLYPLSWDGLSTRHYPLYGF
jgi:hypothetical protein